MAEQPAQYTKGRIERLVAGWAVVAQWLEHWWLKPPTWVRFSVTSTNILLYNYSLCINYSPTTDIDTMSNVPDRFDVLGNDVHYTSAHTPPTHRHNIQGSKPLGGLKRM